MNKLYRFCYSYSISGIRFLATPMRCVIKTNEGDAQLSILIHLQTTYQGHEVTLGKLMSKEEVIIR